MTILGSALPRVASVPNPATSRVGFVFLLLLAAAIILIPRMSFAGEDDDIRVSRYTTVSAVPPASQANPLEAVVQVNFPRAQVHTVGEATVYLLLRTGYHLASAEQLDEQVRNILSLPLPEVHRSIGPYTVSTALSVLLGQPFALSIDPGRREVAYHVEGSPATLSQAAAGKTLVATPLAPAPANAAIRVTNWGTQNANLK